jgi:hypothetical protein
MAEAVQDVQKGQHFTRPTPARQDLPFPVSAAPSKIQGVPSGVRWELRTPLGTFFNILLVWVPRVGQNGTDCPP